MTSVQHVDLDRFCSPKLFPWFVSDVTPPDFADLFDCLLSPSFFPDSAAADTGERDNLQRMVTRWKSYLGSGVFELSVPQNTQLGATNVMADFWTEPWPYWDMKIRSGKLFEHLSGSGLVIFKVSAERFYLWIMHLNKFATGRPKVRFNPSGSY